MSIIKKDYHLDITDILFWIGILIVIIWAIGKTIGLINSPVWIDMIPIYGAVATAMGISLKIGRILQKIEQVLKDVGNIQLEVKDIDKRVTVIESKMD